MAKPDSRGAADSVRSWRSEVDEKLLHGAGFRGVVAGREHVKRIRREVIRRAGHGLLRDDVDSTHPTARRGAMFIKRTTDIIAASLGLILLSPLFLLIAIAIKLTSKGPVVYMQYRLGRNGTWFPTVKFRSMVVDADERLQRLLDEDDDARAEFNAFHKLRDDPRVTKIGSILRSTSLDELPQLINILLGQMSLVGPRAYLAFEVLAMPDTDRILKILSVKPGLTGFWQVGGRNNVEFDERLDMDVFYIQNWSPGMDFYLVVNTVWIMLFGRGTGAA